MSNILNVPSIEIKKFIEKNPNSVLLDVRTEEEWNGIGRPNAESFKITTYFISLLVGPDRKKNDNFLKEFLDKKVAKDKNILVICRSGMRSLTAAKMLEENGYKNCFNIADGFEGNPAVGEGWKKNNLPCK